MSDQRLRELERRFRESGRLADRLAWFNARARAGELAPEVRGVVRGLEEGALAFEQLTLLAYLSVLAAKEVLGDDVAELALRLGGPGAVRVVRGESGTKEDARAWAAGLGQWEGKTVAAALALVTRVALDLLAASEPWEDWLLRADRDHSISQRTARCEATAPRLAALERRELPEPFDFDSGDFDVAADRLHCACWYVREVALCSDPSDVSHWCGEWVGYCVEAAQHELPTALREGHLVLRELLVRAAPRLLERLVPSTAEG